MVRSLVEVVLEKTEALRLLEEAYYAQSGTGGIVVIRTVRCLRHHRILVDLLDHAHDRLGIVSEHAHDALVV